MSSYLRLAEIYDDVMGDRIESAHYIHGLLKQFHPRARTLLELGCGTGSLLSLLHKHYQVTGLDNARGMLRQAKLKVPKASFLCRDITKYNLRESFDAIICVFDTINHVTSFAKWEKIFQHAALHLAEGGIFVFDINTLPRVKRYTTELPYALVGKKNICVIDVTPGEKGRYFLDIVAFSKVKGEMYRRFETSIPEITFETKKVIALAKKFFAKVELRDPDRKRASSASEELYFICSRAHR